MTGSPPVSVGPSWLGQFLGLSLLLMTLAVLGLVRCSVARPSAEACLKFRS